MESRSHPAIRFEQVPIVKGALFDLEKNRADLMNRVVSRGKSTLVKGPLEFHLEEALYLERSRLKRSKKFNPATISTIPRRKRDQKLWKKVKKELWKPGDQESREMVLDTILRHYTDEIAGHFNPSIYWLASRMAPWGFSWLLNAASVRRFLPWGMTQSLQSRLSILGEVPTIQKLAQKGTILLVPTHQSNIDSVLIGYVIYLMSLPPFAYGAGLNLFLNPILNFFMSSLGSYTVDREKTNQIYKMCLKNYSTEILKSGMHSVFFPAGGRVRSGAIESHLKLGLLGTALSAQLENLQEGKANPNIYVVPMTTSYHFVLEASSLIESYLAASGKHRFMGSDSNDVPQALKFLKFFWKFFAGKNSITVRIGKPLDVFGNEVDEAGKSVGPNGTTIDPCRWLSTRGEIRVDAQRDHEYTRRLGEKIVDRYYRENTVLTSHLVAFAYFMALRKKFPQLDLYRFLRLSRQQRTISYSAFVDEAVLTYKRLKKMESDGEVFLSDEFKVPNDEDWLAAGIQHLGMFHDAAVVKRKGEQVCTDDMNLLYYYRNRLAGYGLSMYGEYGQAKTLRGENDKKGFLA